MLSHWRHSGFLVFCGERIFPRDETAMENLARYIRILAFIEDREVIRAILKHLGLWLVRAKPTSKAHAPPALNRSKSGQAGYVLDQFSQLPLNDDPLYPAKRGTTPGRLSFSRRQRWQRNRCARRSLKRPEKLPPMIENVAPHLYPQIPPNPC